MSLSSWWAKESHAALSSEDWQAARNLALALAPARAIIRVVDDGTPPMQVMWSDGISSTDFANRIIRLNARPVMEHRLPWGEQLDLVAGFALHEAAHAKHSADRADVPMGFPTPERRIAVVLLNIAEDRRIEHEVEREYRGSVPYFAKVREWIWSERLLHPPRIESALSEALDDVFVACRFPEHAPPGDETTWWQAWLDDYLAGMDTYTTLRRGLDHLPLDHDDESLVQGAHRCLLRAGDPWQMSTELAMATKRMARDGLTSVPVIIPDANNANAARSVDVDRPPTPPADDRGSAIGPDAERLRSALVFRPESPRSEVKLQRDGDLDDEELWRFASGDHRLFSHRIIESRPDVALGLLVDMSGSMNWAKEGSDETTLDVAYRLAGLFVLALHDQPGVSTAVWGHATHGGRRYTEEIPIIHRLWEPGDPIRRLDLITTLPTMNNLDGHAIAWCADQLRRRDEPQKVLVVLSDGLPEGRGYGGQPAIAHVRAATDWARRQGVHVIQIALDAALRAKDQAAMFGPGNWVPYTDNPTLFRDLGRIMLRSVS